MDALLGRASSRFVFVTLLPTLVLAAFTGAVLASGAPEHTPTLSAIEEWLASLTWRESIALFFIVVVAAVGLHPIQTPLIQILEGYWLTLPAGEIVADLATTRYASLFSRLKQDENTEVTDDASFRRASSARFRLDWLPDRETKLLPTSLGNALRAGEERATARYGMEPTVALPRLIPLLPAEQREQLADRRTQLDAAARMCATSLICSLVGTGLLVPTGRWLYVPLIAFVSAWACYRAAVAAARGYCTDLAAIVDLQHRKLWHALSLDAPRNLLEERQRSAIITDYLSGRELTEQVARSIVWQEPPRT
jgi:hypothetical protein